MDRRSSIAGGTAAGPAALATPAIARGRPGIRRRRAAGLSRAPDAVFGAAGHPGRRAAVPRRIAGRDAAPMPAQAHRRAFRGTGTQRFRLAGNSCDGFARLMHAREQQQRR